MLTLAFDTATEFCSIALGSSRLLAEVQLKAGRSHLELLLPAIDDLLNQQGLTIGDIERLAVGTGPGTFSGLRVGISCARALAQALGRPLAGVSTLYALAQELTEDGRGENLDLLPVVDAKRGQVFCRLFKARGRKVEPLSEILCLNPEELLQALSAMSARRVLAAGNGALAYYSMFAAHQQVDVLSPDDPRHIVSAKHYLEFAAESGLYQAESVLAVKPIYIREPDADKTVLVRKRAPWL